jgi:crotonobetainyl-CoA:carnitine CoA-transferase CaiB-like acyl-CoA transferase
MALGIVEQQFWDNFIAAADDVAPDLRDPRYADEAGRRQHGDALLERLRIVLRALPAAEWLARFNQHDVPAQLVLTLAEASRTPQIVERAMVVERDGERHLPFPVRANGVRGGWLHRLAPEAGQDSNAVLSEIGFTAGEIARLRASRILGRRTDAG